MCLDLAVCLGSWLLPSRMVKNTVRTATFKNQKQLKQANKNVKFRKNSDVNKEKKASLLIEGKKPKIN